MRLKLPLLILLNNCLHGKCIIYPIKRQNLRDCTFATIIHKYDKLLNVDLHQKCLPESQEFLS